jgi:hypothetical protein
VNIGELPQLPSRLTGENSFMRLSQNGKRSDVLPQLRDTLTWNRRYRGSTHPTVSSPWNSVNPLSSRPDGPVA